MLVHAPSVPDYDNQEVRDAGEEYEELSFEDLSSTLHHPEITGEMANQPPPVGSAEEDQIPDEPTEQMAEPKTGEDVEVEYDHDTSLEEPASSMQNPEENMSDTAVDAAPIPEVEESMHEMAAEYQIDEHYEPLEDIGEIPLAGVAMENELEPSDESSPLAEEVQEESTREIDEIPVKQGEHEVSGDHHPATETLSNIDMVEPRGISGDDIALDSEENQEMYEKLQQPSAEDLPVAEPIPPVENVEPQVSEATHDIEKAAVEVPFAADESPEKDEYLGEHAQPMPGDTLDDDLLVQDSEMDNEAHPILRSSIVEPTVVDDEAKENAPVEQADSDQV